MEGTKTIQYARTFTGGVIPSLKKTPSFLQLHFPIQEGEEQREMGVGGLRRSKPHEEGGSD